MALGQSGVTITIYRQAHEFPPNVETDYVSVFERRQQRGQAPLSNPRLDRASHGLSVQSTLEAARIHARENKHLGSILVRYHLPESVGVQLQHLVGDRPTHLTLTMTPLTALADYLDMDWWEFQDFSTETAW